MIIKTPCSTRASNRTQLEKQQVVLCITLLSLHINISLSSHLKMCLFWRKKASDVQHCGTASRGQRSVCCSWPFGAENKFLLVRLSMDFSPMILNRTATTLQVQKKIKNNNQMLVMCDLKTQLHRDNKHRGDHPIGTCKT